MTAAIPPQYYTPKQMRLLGIDEKIIVDLFAGGGGFSKGIEMALGRSPDIAINHNDNALSMHCVNHPQTQHFVADVREICPIQATQGRPVGLLHLSPDCTHFSQSKGGQARDRKIRALSWVGIRWGGQVTPDVITLENVKQLRDWGPLVAKRDKTTGRVIKLDGSVAGKGERVPVQQQYLIPDPKRKGKTWRQFIATLERLGYVVETRVLIAADYETPTSRARLFMVARRDGQPIVWPAPTRAEKPTGKLKPWRAAAECIDWSIPCPSIFSRKRPLVEKTLRRIAKGTWKYVLNNADPFLVPITRTRDDAHSTLDPLRTITTSHGGEFAVCAPQLVPVTHGGGDGRAYDVTDPVRTVTAAHRGEIALAAPHLVKFRGQSNGVSIENPMPTITSGGGARRPAGAAHALGVAAVYLAQMNGGKNEAPGHPVTKPASTITTIGSQQQLVTAYLATLRQHSTGIEADQPLPTVAASGEHHAVIECTLSRAQLEGADRVAAFLTQFYSEGGQIGDLKAPLGTVTTKDRFALITVLIRNEPYVIVDIGLRMLTPRELYRAQGFPDDYVIDHGHDGRRFSKSRQVHMVGNSVPPPVAAALISANVPSLAVQRTPFLRRQTAA